MATHVSCEQTGSAGMTVAGQSVTIWQKVASIWNSWNSGRARRRRDHRMIKTMLATEGWLLRDVYRLEHGDIIAAKRSRMANRDNPDWCLWRFLSDRSGQKPVTK